MGMSINDDRLYYDAREMLRELVSKEDLINASLESDTDDGEDGDN